MILNASAAQQKLDALARAEAALAKRPEAKDAREAAAARRRREGISGSEGIRRRVEETAAAAAQGL